MNRGVEQGDEADEAFGGMVARMDMPPHARAGQLRTRAPLRSLSPVLGRLEQSDVPAKACAAFGFNETDVNVRARHSSRLREDVSLTQSHTNRRPRR